MTDYKWNKSILQKHAEGLDEGVLITRSNRLMGIIEKAAGESALDRYAWYQTNQKSVIREDQVFGGHGREEIASHLMVFDQLKHEIQSKPLNMEVVEKYRSEIKSEALQIGDGVDDKAVQWLLENRKTRLDIISVPNRQCWQEYMRAWGTVEKELMFSLRRHKMEKSQDSGTEFQDIWKKITSIGPGLLIKNWTQFKGYLGGDMTIKSVSENAVTFDVPTAINDQVVPVKDFEKVWGLWRDYKAGKVKRRELLDVTRHSKYIISTLKYFEDI